MSSRSRWQRLPIIAASAVAPLIVLDWLTHLLGEGADEPRVAALVLLALPPFAATAAGIFVSPAPRARAILLCLLVCVIVYPLAAAFWFFIVMGLPYEMAKLWNPLAIAGEALVAAFLLAAFLAVFAGGGVVGFTAAGGIYDLLRRSHSRREIRLPWPGEARETDHPTPHSRWKKTCQWFGSVAGIAAIVLPFWFTKVSDILSVIPGYFLFSAAWLSAGCVVLILGPRSSSDSS